VRWVASDSGFEFSLPAFYKLRLGLRSISQAKYRSDRPITSLIWTPRNLACDPSIAPGPRQATALIGLESLS
jgi:hypothetical protein